MNCPELRKEVEEKNETTTEIKANTETSKKETNTAENRAEKRK